MLHSVGCIDIATRGTPLRGAAWGDGKHRVATPGLFVLQHRAQHASVLVEDGYVQARLGRNTAPQVIRRVPCLALLAKRSSSRQCVQHLEPMPPLYLTALQPHLVFEAP